MAPAIPGRHAPRPTPSIAPTFEQRALALWPRLDRRALGRCGHDPRRIAALVSRRTKLPMEAIVGLLVAGAVSDDDRATWFG